MEAEALIKAFDKIDFHKFEKKAFAFLGAFLMGGLLVVVTTKFINDNFSFRIKKISNLPDKPKD